MYNLPAKRSWLQGLRPCSATAYWRAFSLLACAGWACSPKPEPLLIGQVVVDLPEGAEGAEGDDVRRVALRGAVYDHIGRDSAVRLDEASANNYLLRVRIVEDPLVTANQEMDVVLRAPDRDADYEVAVEVPLDEEKSAAWVRTFSSAWARLRRLRALDAMPEEALVQALSNPDIGIRDFALSRVGQRRVGAAVRPICAMLQDESDPGIVLRGMGALVAIGDSNAVGPLIDLSNRKEPEFVVQVAFAVSALGGRTAEAYLVTLASGHPDDDVRHGAQDALDEMLRRNGGPRRPGG